MRIRSMACLWITLALAAGCTASAAPEGQPGAEPASDASATGTPLEGTDWRLVEVGGRPALAAEGAGAPNLRLDPAQRQARGNTGCNSFSGSYELGGATLRFGPLATTRRACVDERMNRQEGELLRALADTRAWRVSRDTLVLTGDAGPVARFAAGAAR